MKIIETLTGLKSELLNSQSPLGLVPTMGFLHEGHMALIRRARTDNATVAVSIFVNPAQFGPKEDLSSYPRDMVGDLAKLENAHVDVVFVPSTEEVYPEGFDTHVEPGEMAERLEGASRPGHLQGVATVVCKLLSMVRPNRVYFGQKDAQQVLVVKRVNADLNLGAEVVIVPTVRAPDGLAISSRNIYLKPTEREAATVLHRALLLAANLDSNDALKTKLCLQEFIEAERLAEVDYISVADPETLKEMEVIDRPALLSIAVWIGKLRLIDNALLKPS